MGSLPKWIAWIACTASCLAFPALAHAQSDRPAAIQAGAAGAAQEYQIGPEDLLQISVWREEGLTKEVLVRPDGGITFPLVGDVQAAGKTTLQLSNEINERLQKYVPDAVVTVAVQRIASNKIYVIGKVNKPGEYVAGRYLDVLQALSLAGGLTPFAAENGIKVIRRQQGKDLVFAFRYSEVKAGSSLEQNIILKGGDTIVVP